MSEEFESKKVFLLTDDQPSPVLCDLSVTDTVLYLTTWHKQGDQIDKPSVGYCGETTFGEDLSPRLTGAIFHAKGVAALPWTGAMVPGTVWYGLVNFDGTLGTPAETLVNLDDLASGAPPAVKEAMQYPHWFNNTYCDITPLLEHLGLGKFAVFMMRIGRIDRTGTASKFTDDDVKLRAFGTCGLGFVGEFDQGRDDIVYRVRNPNDGPVIPPQPDGWVFG